MDACPYCQHPVNDTDDFCPDCGRTLAPARPVVADLRYAGLLLRLTAFAVDWLLLLIGSSLLIGFSAHGDVEAVRQHPFQVTVITNLIAIAYFSICEGSAWQATLGKRLLQLQVVFPAGSISYPRAFLRNALKFLPNLLPFFSLVWLGAEALVLGRDREHRALHDMAAKTHVVEAS
jgi:uncharacterized RDD family membrane protein YckC